jgi:hypothetical protein
MSFHEIEINDENIKEIAEKEHSFQEFEYLVTSHQYEVREKVALNPKLPAVYANWMAQDVAMSVRVSLADNPNLSAEIIHKLSEDEKIAVICAIAKHPKLPQGKLIEFARHQSYLVREAAASNPTLPASELSRLRNDSEWGVRRRVAENRNTEPKELESLAEDSYLEVISAIAENPSAPANLLSRLLERTEGDEGIRYFRDSILQNPTFPEERVIEIYLEGKKPNQDDSEDDYMLSNSGDRIAIAQRFPLSERAIELIVDDPYQVVRGYLARNLSLTDKYLSKLALDSEPSVRTDVVNNPNASPETKATATLLGLESYNDD